MLCPVLRGAAAACQAWLWHLLVCPRSWLGHRQVSLPSQALGQQHFVILLLWSIPLSTERNLMAALPICAGRPELLLHLLPCLAHCPQRDRHFWKGMFILVLINGANRMQTQPLKKPKQCSPLLFISGKRGNL